MVLGLLVAITLPTLAVPEGNTKQLSLIDSICNHRVSISTAITYAHMHVTPIATVSIAGRYQFVRCHPVVILLVTSLFSFCFFPQSSGIVTAPSFGNCEFVSNLYYIVIAK